MTEWSWHAVSSCIYHYTNSKLETRNPKPETRNSKPETQNPKLACMSENLPITEALQKEPVVVLTRYLEGDLSVEETQQLEQVVAEDPFMADALEGLKTMPEPARAQAIGQELKFKAHKLLRAKRPIISLYHFNQYATAAVAVLVVLFVATAAIMLTSRIGEKPADTASFTEAETNPENDQVGNADGDKLPNANETFTYSPGLADSASEKSFKEIETNPQIAQNTLPNPVPPQPAEESRRPTGTVTTKPGNSTSPDFDGEDDKLDEVRQTDTRADTESPVTVQSYEELTTEPTLTNTQLESFKQAMTEGEYNAYREALGKLQQSLAVVNEDFMQNSTFLK